VNALEYNVVLVGVGVNAIYLIAFCGWCTE